MPFATIRLLLLFALPSLLVLPFDPEWLDFERARRGILMLGIALLCITTASRELRWPRGPLWGFAVLPDLAVLSLLWAYDSWLGVERSGYWLALALVPLVLPRGPAPRRALLLGLVTAGLVSSIYGIAQSLGLDWPLHYAAPHEPVSTLGNRNAAAEWTLLAAAAALGLRPRLALPALAVLGIYLGANGGRAALIGWALLLALFVVARVWLAPRASWPRGLVLAGAALAVLGPLLGSAGLRHAPPSQLTVSPDASAAGAPPARLDAEPSTLEVRKRLYPAVLDLALEEFPLGTGAGNFARSFPPHRDPAEVELSMQGAGMRPTRVTRAHSDPLELFAELGVLGFLVVLFVLGECLFLAVRRRLPLLAAGALIAFVPITLARAPLFNAPVAFALVALLSLALPGRPLATSPAQIGRDDAGPGQPPSPGALLFVQPFLAVLLASLAFPLLAGESQGAAHARALRAEGASLADAERSLVALDTAITWDHYSVQWRYLRALRTGQVLAQLDALEPRRHELSQAQLEQFEALRARAPQVIPDLVGVLERDPHHYGALYLLALIAFQHKENRSQGKAAIEHLSTLHPNYPGAAAIAARYAQLELAASTLRELARDPRSRRQPPDLEAGYAAIREVRSAYPRLPELQRLQLRYELLRLDLDQTLALHRQLADKQLLSRHLEQLLKSSQKARPQTLSRILALHTRLTHLARELFPNAPEFR
jgi:O-antigen ligase